MSASSLRIAVPPIVVSSFLAYAKLREGDDPKALTAEWLARVCEDPIRGALSALLEMPAVRVSVSRRHELPDPPLEMLRLMRLGPEEERRFHASTHVVVVNVGYPMQPPALQIHGALAIASAVASAREGVVLDPEVPRILPLARLEEPLPADGSIAVAKYIMCPMSTSDAGEGWVTTRGMAQFGLPNLQMRNVPPKMTEIAPALGAVAQRVLLEALMQGGQRGGEELISEIALPKDLVISQQFLAAAYGKNDAKAHETTVGLSYDGRSPDGSEPFLTVGPPASFRGAPTEWYHVMLRELLGGPGPELAPVIRAPNDDALARAKERALSEWPDVKERFRKGLGLSQKLFVKRGFPVGEGGTEHMWANVTKIGKTDIFALLANDSAYDPKLRAGKLVSFPESEISDWTITDGKNREGGYSIAALMGKPS